MTTHSKFWLVLLSAAVIACSKKHAEEATTREPKRAASAHVDEPAHDALPTKVQLAKNVVDDAKITTAPVVKGVLVQTISLPGEIAVDPDKSARVASPVAGRIMSIAFQEGSAVKKGDVLATVRVPDVANVRAASAASSARATAAQSNATRVQALADKGLAAAQEAIAAKAEAASLDAESRALHEQVRVLGLGSAPGSGSDLTLRAPLTGVVLSRSAVLGQPVTADETIASLADLSEVWFLGRVFEKDLERVHVGSSVEVELNAYTKQRFSGTVEYVSRQIDPVARTLSARIRLTNTTDQLRVGLYGVARVSLGENEAKEPSLLVPRTAVTEIGKKPVVFVRQSDGDFELHEVMLGNAALGQVEIVAGLREGEQVVVEGIFTLKSVVLKSTLADED
jgi:cobalt-zinc-cadmium efflux system membrane fusion protein